MASGMCRLVVACLGRWRWRLAARVELPGVVLLCGVRGCVGASGFRRVVCVGRPDPVPPAPSAPLRRLLNLSSPVVALSTLPPQPRFVGLVLLYGARIRHCCVRSGRFRWQVSPPGAWCMRPTGWWVGGAMGWYVSLACVVLGDDVATGGALATGGRWYALWWLRGLSTSLLDHYPTTVIGADWCRGFTDGGHGGDTLPTWGTVVAEC